MSGRIIGVIIFYNITILLRIKDVQYKCPALYTANATPKYEDCATCPVSAGRDFSAAKTIARLSAYRQIKGVAKIPAPFYKKRRLSRWSKVTSNAASDAVMA